MEKSVEERVALTKHAGDEGYLELQKKRDAEAFAKAKQQAEYEADVKKFEQEKKKYFKAVAIKDAQGAEVAAQRVAASGKILASNSKTAEQKKLTSRIINRFRKLRDSVKKAWAKIWGKITGNKKNKESAAAQAPASPALVAAAVVVPAAHAA